MRIQVNDAGIIINSMGHPLDARKLCESYNDLRAMNAELLAALKACIEGFRDTAERSNGTLYQKANTAQEQARAAIEKATK